MVHVCEICQKVFGRPNRLTAHMGKDHGGPLVKRFPCPRCGVRFLRREHMVRHSHICRGVPPPVIEPVDQGLEEPVNPVILERPAVPFAVVAPLPVFPVGNDDDWMLEFLDGMDAVIPDPLAGFDLGLLDEDPAVLAVEEVQVQPQLLADMVYQYGPINIVMSEPADGLFFMRVGGVVPVGLNIVNEVVGVAEEVVVEPDVLEVGGEIVDQPEVGDEIVVQPEGGGVVDFVPPILDFADIVAAALDGYPGDEPAPGML